MLAMTFRGPYRVRIDHKPEPQIEHPDDVVLRVTRAAICGSDLHLYHGLIPDTRVGATFGHEFVGVVEEVGSNVQNVKAGDHVLVPFNISCGACYFCSRQLYADCLNTNPNSTLASGVYGYSHTTGGYDGGQAEYVRVPFADVCCIKIPSTMAEDDAVLLTDVFPTGYQAAEMGGIAAGDTVAVFGAGPIGLMAAKSAWLLGAGRVIVIDHLDYRLEFARQFAQCETANFLEVDDIVKHLREMTARIGPDVCIDAVGVEADGRFLQTLLGVKMKLIAGATTALNWAIDAVRKAGTVSIIGVYGPPFNLVPIGDVMNKGLTLRSSQASVKRYIPRLIEHIQNGLVDPKAIITHHVPLEEIAGAYHMFSSKLDGCIKTIVIPPKSSTWH